MIYFDILILILILFFELSPWFFILDLKTMAEPDPEPGGKISGSSRLENSPIYQYTPPFCKLFSGSVGDMLFIIIVTEIKYMYSVVVSRYYYIDIHIKMKYNCT